MSRSYSLAVPGLRRHLRNQILFRLLMAIAVVGFGILMRSLAPAYAAASLDFVFYLALGAGGCIALISIHSWRVRGEALAKSADCEIVFMEDRIFISTLLFSAEDGGAKPYIELKCADIIDVEVLNPHWPDPGDLMINIRNGPNVLLNRSLLGETEHEFLRGLGVTSAKETPKRKAHRYHRLKVAIAFALAALVFFAMTPVHIYATLITLLLLCGIPAAGLSWYEHRRKNKWYKSMLLYTSIFTFFLLAGNMGLAGHQSTTFTLNVESCSVRSSRWGVSHLAHVTMQDVRGFYLLPLKEKTKINTPGFFCQRGRSSTSLIEVRVRQGALGWPFIINSRPLVHSSSPSI